MKRKTYIITGGGSGIGLECLKVLSKNNIIIATYNRTRIKKKKNIIPYKLNLENESEIKKFLKKIKNILKKSSSITFLSFATFKKDDLLHKIKKNDLEKSFKINVFSNYYICSNLIPLMINKKNNIILMGSSLAFLGDRGISSYSGSKYALKGLLNSIMQEYSKLGINCNLLSLGFFYAPLWLKLPSQIKRKILSNSPTGKLGNISDIIKTIKFIESNKYLNGSTINLDGGYGKIS